MNEEEELKNAGIYLYNEGKYESALAKFLLTSQQDLGVSMMYLGFCYTRLGQTDAAIVALESIHYELLNPVQYKQSKIALGYLYIEANLLEKAEALFESLSDYDNENSQVFSMWGYIAQLQGQYDVAIRRFRRAIQLDSGNANALNSLAYLYAQIDDISSMQEALGHARRAVAISPQNASYLDTLGWVCLKLNRKSDALEYLQRALSYRENDTLIKEHLEAARQAVTKR
ncbi:tetratricopeptide repeat protein [Entomospira culicis]|uniref:Tetratricopeptide repeat protein n=1 Tax=Entomospira culicis TaxID=2719989 RepID=A0A968KWE4_9SPIO|nr:tetratricopeptide repeat protein [Entomospira culicis]NIZ18897.1 tetratricopeptide repeat protein [Entomospira culicis]NIZ69112.1 tetratricopeptide repeat protein [Entomospira culicis]WDI37698.1 tetratricopeptide repeat protein [Entomospira culicis]WDI39326.1 tetratricopeptide repeat protein [Entomospira culicis]